MTSEFVRSQEGKFVRSQEGKIAYSACVRGTEKYINAQDIECPNYVTLL